MKTQEQEINEVIEKNLPAQVGDVLKRRLAQADADAYSLKKCQEQAVGLQERVKGLEAEISQYRLFDDRNAKLLEREFSVSERERRIEVAKLEYELTAEKEKAEFAKNVALGLVRNIEYRKNVMANQSDPGRNQHGNPITIYKSERSEETQTGQ